MKTITCIVILAAAVIGGIIGIYCGRKKSREAGAGGLKQQVEDIVMKKGGKDWEQLMKTQVSLDRLAVSDILAWVDSYEKKMVQGDTFFLLKATKANVHKIGYEYKSQVNPDTNVIACVINTDTGDINHIRLFSFGEMDAQVLGLFGDSDYAVITG